MPNLMSVHVFDVETGEVFYKLEGKNDDKGYLSFNDEPHWINARTIQTTYEQMDASGKKELINQFKVKE